MEYLLTGFFTFEYITRLYCSPKPAKYAFNRQPLQTFEYDKPDTEQDAPDQDNVE